jgi:RNA polymerase sigma-70 factor (ECF subfamily)
VHESGGWRVWLEGTVIARQNIFLHTTPFRGSIDLVGQATSARAADRLVQLYCQYGAIVFSRCRQMLGDAAAAEDLTQDTFLRVHRHLDDLPEDEGVLPWLYRIATNLCLNAIRDGRARPILVEQPPERPGADRLDDRLADRDLVCRLIARVSPKVGTTAWMFHVDGMGQEEIAEVLGISRRMVAKRLSQFTHRSRKFLRAEGS